MSRILSPWLLLLVGACSDAKQPRDFSAEFDAVSTKCHTPRGWLHMSDDGSVSFKPSEAANYKDGMCVLEELKARNLPMKRGYIANSN